MSLTSNPFHILGAKMTDDRRRIVALAKEKSFGGDEEAVRQAQGILLTPRKRLAAEIAWLPGVEPDQIGELLSVVRTASVLPRDLPALARANLLAHMLVHHRITLDVGARQPGAVAEFAKRIALLAGAHQAARADEMTTFVNEGRLAAGVPMASKQDVIDELRDRATSFRDTIEHCLDNLPLPVMVEIVTATVNVASRSGSRHAPALIDSLIDSYYERRMSGKMDEHKKEITALVSQIRKDVASGHIVNVKRSRLEEVKRSLRAWDVLAQPVQVSFASRGMSHLPSDEIMHDTRNLAVELFNKYGVVFLSDVRGLTKTLRQVFAEMEPITELLDKDVATLDDLAAKATKARAVATEEAARAARASERTEGLIVVWSLGVGATVGGVWANDVAGLFLGGMLGGIVGGWLLFIRALFK